MKTARVDALESIAELNNAGMESLARLTEKLNAVSEALNAQHLAVQSVNLVVLAMGILGVIWMYLGKKQGFHLYIIYTLASICSVYLFVSAAVVPTSMTLMGFLLGGLFVFLYSRHLHWMK